MNEPLLDVQNLGIAEVQTARTLVHNLSFSVKKNEIVCLVGESGSGKSITAQALMGLLPQHGLRRCSGRILLEGCDLTALSPAPLRSLLGVRLAMVFQEPQNALNPSMTIGAQIGEALKIHRNIPAGAQSTRVLELMQDVHLPDPENLKEAYPHQLSGGQRQRVLIAAALAMNPALLIADEPTTALDVTTAAQILSLLKDLQRRHGMGVLLITHDFGIVADIADRVLVMQHGRLVETGPRLPLLTSPKTDYTRRLLAAVPGLIPRPPRPQSDTPVLCVEALGKAYENRRLFRSKAPSSPALRDISFTLYRGQNLGIAGESGAGKSTLARCLAGLLPSTTGTITLEGRQISHTGKPLWHDVQMVFQDPATSLNPRRRLMESLIEGPLHQGQSRKEAMAHARDLIAYVGIDPTMLTHYPHEFSGGERQRLCIARALIMRPKLLIADEPVSALDVCVQADVLRLLDAARQDFQLSMLLITHDLRVAAQICDQIIIMKQGRIVEQGDTATLFSTPQHAYTRALLDAVPGRHTLS